MKWADMDQPFAEGSYDMAVTGWSDSGAAHPKGVQIAMEEIKLEQKLDVLPDPAKAFDWSFVQEVTVSRADTLKNLGFSFCAGGLELRIWQ